MARRVSEKRSSAWRPAGRVECLRSAAARRLPLRSEAGVAVALTMMVMTVGLMLASVGSVAAMSSLRNSARDTDSKRALAAAETGVEQALLRHNKILTTDAFPCLVLGASSGLVAGSPLANGWCPEVSGTVDDGSFTYTVKPAALTDTVGGQQRITIVSEGSFGEVTRRISLDAIASTGVPVFAEAGVIGLDGLEMVGNARVYGDVGTNSDLELTGNAAICGDAFHGPGRSLIAQGNAGLCDGGALVEQQIALGPPDPGDVADDNANGRFFAHDPKQGNVEWDPSTRVMELSGSSALTLGGSNYSFCELRMSGNSSIYIAAGATVRIWFDSPESCGQGAGHEQLSMTGNSEISTTGGDPGDVGLVFLGSSTTPTTITLAGNGRANEMMVYAPRSDVHVSGNGNYTGGIAGQTMDIAGNGEITADPSILDFTVSVQTAYDRERFIECTGPLTDSPAEGC